MVTIIGYLNLQIATDIHRYPYNLYIAPKLIIFMRKKQTNNHDNLNTLRYKNKTKKLIPPGDVGEGWRGEAS
jgi:hypothetical protein